MKKLCLFAFMFLIQPDVYFIYDTSEGTNFIFFHMDNQLFQHFQNIIHSFPQLVCQDISVIYQVSVHVGSVCFTLLLLCVFFFFFLVILISGEFFQPCSLRNRIPLSCFLAYLFHVHFKISLSGSTYSKNFCWSFLLELY